MSKTSPRYADADIRRIVGLAAAFSNEDQLSEAEVRDIGDSLGLSGVAVQQALQLTRSQERSATEITCVSQPGLFVAISARNGFTAPIIIRMGLSSLILPFGISALVMEGFASAAVLLLVGGVFLYAIGRQIELALSRYFVIALPNRCLVGQSGLGSARVVEATAEGLRLLVRTERDVDGGFEVSPLYKLIAVTSDGQSVDLFVGRKQNELEMVRSRFEKWLSEDPTKVRS